MEGGNFDDFVLERCKTMIQQRLGWEDSATWTNSDFTKLSEIIHDKTAVRLSPATLKRLWGKVRYENKPTITTLNTLAQFLGYEDLRAVKQALIQEHERKQQNLSDDDVTYIASETAPRRPKNYKRLVQMAFVVGILAIVTIVITGIASSVDEKTKAYSFSSKKIVSQGVPNSVVFDYDATMATGDSVYIQQSWDERLRARVSKNDHQHTSIYYTPGYFQAKLVVNNEIVREHNLFITSNSWIALVKQDPVPVYFKNEDFRRDGALSLPVEKLVEKSIQFQPETPWTSYYNVQDFGELKTDRFSFHTRIRNDYKDGAGVCQSTQILLLTEGNVIIIPLSIKGCVSDLNLLFGEPVSGKTHDLSAFGVDLSDWVEVKCEVKDKKGRIFINNVPAIETPYERSEKIVGMIFRFQGSGSIDEVTLTNGSGKNVLDDKF